MSPIISNKTENSIYCCLATQQGHNDKNETYYKPFNRYLVYYRNKDHITENISGKKVYSLVEEEENKENSIVFNNEFAEHQWDAHLSMICPYNAQNSSNLYHPRFNVLLYDQFVLHYYVENRDKLEQFTHTSREAKNVVVMIDNRKNIFSVISLYITFINLKKSLWHCIVICNKDNVEFFRRFLGDNVDYITEFNYPTKKFDIETYNDMLKSDAFWNKLREFDFEKVLFVQDDGMIVKSGLEDHFLKYDYVGAPWERQWSSEDPNKFIKENINADLVGNGGVSLRNIEKMGYICTKYKDITKQLHYNRLQQQPEDVFFSYCCKQENLKMPNYQEAQMFSSEQVLKPGSYGFHKMWAYHHLSNIETMFNSYLVTYKV
jgi:hypothetical protein